jgi:hypothetical protein
MIMANYAEVARLEQPPASSGNIVTCRAHGWKYDVTTENTAHVPGYGVASYAVKVDDGKSAHRPRWSCRSNRMICRCRLPTATAWIDYRLSTRWQRDMADE